MFCVYILYSNSINQYYCGQTLDLNDRMRRHNNGETQSIKHGIPWASIGFVYTQTRKEAMSPENQIKKRGIRRWLEKNKDNLNGPG